MNQQQRNFHEAVKNYGGIVFPPDPFFEFVKREIINQIDEYRKLPGSKLPNLTLDFIHNDIFNAMATRQGSDYIIGLRSGAVVLLNNMFEKMFASPHVFADLGNSAAEVDEQHFIDFARDEGIKSTKYNVVLPKDNLRQNAAKFCFRSAVSYLAFHELGHIMHGHVNLPKAKGGGEGAWLEFSESIGEKLDYQAIQCLENHADQFATNLAFSAGEAAVRAYKSREDFHLHYFMSSMEIYFRYWSFAILSMHVLTSLIESNIADPRELKHPPPSMRLKFILIYLQDLITRYEEKRTSGYLEISKEQIFKQVWLAAKQVEIAFTKVTPLETFPINIFAIDEKLENHAKWLDEREEQVRKALECYRLGPI